MTAAATARAPFRTPLQPPIRLGFDDGWLLLGPTFLNLQRPALLVDQVLFGSTVGFNFESFAVRDPRTELLACGVEVTASGGGISLWSELSSCLAWHWFEPAWLPFALVAHPEVILIVGDTYEVELTWSALWTCSIGLARIRRGGSNAVSMIRTTSPHRI